MTSLRKVPILLLAAILSVSINAISFADTGASIIVGNYNSLNGGRGVIFELGNSDFYHYENGHVNSGELYVLNWYDRNTHTYREFANTEAYVDSMYPITTGWDEVIEDHKPGAVIFDTRYYSTFCIAPDVDIAYNSMATAKLNYADNMSKTSDGHILSLGAATLYAKFATGNLSAYNYQFTDTDVSARSDDAVALRDALRFLIGASTKDICATNVFVQYLLGINSSLAYWQATYDPGQIYSEIGDYAVFVMNVTQNEGSAQDLLYVAKIISPGRPSTPEPATVLLWSIGGIGMAGAAWRKRRSK